jgi:ABC-type sugar transport system substrate-binding protein
MPDRFLGLRLGDYVTEERIGRGAMAVVYRAYQPSVQRHIALKVIKLDMGLGEDDDFRRRFAQEAELIAALEHIHILPVFDYGIADGEVAYIAMRLLRGGTLADLLKQGPVPLDRAADIITQVARGLSYAHRNNIIHRDLKPSNILFDNSGNAYLSDFGLAKVLAMPDMTKPGHLVGTPAYVSPEALRGEQVDHRADIYSLGILAFEILTGRVPFEAQSGNLLSLIRMHLQVDPPSMREINPDIPPEVEAVILRALAKQPDQRYDDAEQLANALNNALGRRHSTSTHPKLTLPRTVAQVFKPAQRRFHPAVGLSVVAVLVLLGLVLFALTRGPVGLGTLAPATLLAGVTGTREDVIPTPAEIELARARLGAEGRIGFIACTLDSVFQVTRAREFADYAAEYGLAYTAYDSINDPNRQLALIEQARIDGVRGFIICPLNTTALIPVLDSLREASIPVVFITMFESGYGLTLDSDNYEIGLRIGRYAGEILRDEHGGEGNVFVLNYPGFPSADVRTDGMKAGVNEIAPNATFVGEGRGFTREDGYQTISNALNSDLSFDIIVSMNDAGSFGAIDALQEAQIPTDEVAIVSANAEPLALEYIRDQQYLRGTVGVNRTEGSHIAFDGIVRMLAGATLPETIVFAPGELYTADTLPPP